LIEDALDAGFGQIRGFEFKKQTQFHGRASRYRIYAIPGGIGKAPQGRRWVLLRDLPDPAAAWPTSSGWNAGR
jgi:hypothetical protein